MKKVLLFISFLSFISLVDGGVYAARKQIDTIKPCVSREVRAQKISTKEVKVFSSCSVPEGWVELGRSGFLENTSGVRDTQSNLLIKISIPQASSKRKLRIMTKDFIVTSVNATLLSASSLTTKRGVTVVSYDSDEAGIVYLSLQAKKSKSRSITLQAQYEKAGKILQSDFSYDLMKGNGIQKDPSGAWWYEITRMD